MPIVKYKDLGKMSYKDSWDLQQSIHDKMKEDKLSNRDSTLDYVPDHFLLMCEHNHVYTLGKSGSEDHLLYTEAQRKDEGIEYFKINRGGDITYHGPGQITCYPIFDLDDFFNDVHKYVRSLEEVVIRTIAHYGIEGQRYDGYTGVWVKNGQSMRKICAIGVHMSKWVTLHGLALNVNNDLSMYDGIIPCGITQAKTEVTSMEKEVKSSIDFEEVKLKLKDEFAEVFEFEFKKENK